MGLLKYIEILFPKAPSDKDMELRRERTVGAILSRYSEGNINLNRGKYVSEKRAKKLKKKAASYSFE